MDKVLNCWMVKNDNYFQPMPCSQRIAGWTQGDLQKKSKLGIETIGNFERGISNQTSRTLDDIKRAFEGAGIEFIDDQKGKGVKLLDGKKK